MTAFTAGQRVLASDLNTATQQGAWDTTFVPSWTQSGGSPALGNGTLVTGFIHTSRVISGRYQYVFGSTTNFGTGISPWFFTLPVTPNVPGATGGWEIGTWSGVSGATFFMGSVRLKAAGAFDLIVNNSGALVHTTNPGTWASGNQLQLNFQYEAAA